MINRCQLSVSSMFTFSNYRPYRSIELNHLTVHFCVITVLEIPSKRWHRLDLIITHRTLEIKDKTQANNEMWSHSHHHESSSLLCMQKLKCPVKAQRKKSTIHFQALSVSLAFSVPVPTYGIPSSKWHSKFNHLEYKFQSKLNGWPFKI